MSDETDNWDSDETFTYTITGKQVIEHEWIVQSCGKQLTEDEVKRICDVEYHWDLRERRYRYVTSVQGADADGVEITISDHSEEHEYEILEVYGEFKEEEE
tara:strand:- start:587 stop:889 length:303 start_codon:yes stop_codon:yes gene_type:complete